MAAYGLAASVSTCQTTKQPRPPRQWEEDQDAIERAQEKRTNDGHSVLTELVVGVVATTRNGQRHCYRKQNQ